MTRARLRVLILIATAIVVAAAVALAFRNRGGDEIAPRAPEQRPVLLLLTSLPLLFGEDFSLEGGSPALKALLTRYRVAPIIVTSEVERGRGRLLLMAHPRAQPAEDLVALDDWVRSGGRLLLLADPMLEWPSKRPLGDPLRPPPMFMDTGLLAHWGLRLDPPQRRGIEARTLAGYDIVTVSPGSLHGSCDISADGFIARCRIGKGTVTVIADADLLDVERLGEGGKKNLDAVLVELARLERD
jgi:hypothetical protein